MLILVRELAKYTQITELAVKELIFRVLTTFVLSEQDVEIMLRCKDLIDGIFKSSYFTQIVF